ncbi:MAG: class I SAM-dependent methyltransferase [Planctomycetes bacterium]|nr:class I SAM-dependent methyltransferase [Planctomycetota bacterium]
MERRLEPEVMDDPEQAGAYAAADFDASNQAFADRCVEALRGVERGLVVDLGCGPADIPLRLARALPPGVRVVGVDASAAMLALARHAVGGAARVDLVRAYLPDLPLRPGACAAVVSNSLLHHLPDPAPFWRAVRALGRPGAPVVVGDLFRPPSEDDARRIVREAAVSDHPLLERDFFASLLAAFTIDEVCAQVRDAGLAGALRVGAVSERHLLVRGRLPG